MKTQQIIYDKKFDLHFINKYASLMALGNGYLGLRSAYEEDYPDQTRGMYISGVYNKSSVKGTSELVNIPDITHFHFEIDGEIFSLLDGKIHSYERTLNLVNGEITRRIVWENRFGDRFRFCFQRFVSKNDLHLLALKVTVTSLDKAVTFNIMTGIDAQQTNFGNQHLTEENVRVFDEEVMQGIYETTESGHIVAVTTSCSYSIKGKVSFLAKNRKLQTTMEIELPQNTPFIVEKLGTVYSSLDQEYDGLDPQTAGLNALHAHNLIGYDKLMKKSAHSWNNFWQKKRVKISSTNDFDQLALDYAIYQLESMTPAHDERFSIGAKGLTGEGYKGHVFWDTEIFMAPFQLFTEPETAKKLLRYRYLHLDQAKEKAVLYHYKGALFPWESAFTGKEETPEFAAINIRTGKRQKVASALAEHHIVADIAYTAVQYYQATLDDEFMKKEGLALLKETALFWISRVTEVDGKLFIKDVIGPDEYTEHIDNNAYTNYMAYYNVEQAIYFMNKYADQNQTLLNEGQDFLNRLYLPKPNVDNIIPQDDTFLSKPEIDLSTYKENQGSQGILLDYSRQEVNEMQILKQADVVMLLYLFPDLFSKDVVSKNLHYYEKRTIHDSSLSKAIHALVAARCGERKLAYELFQEACLIDLGPKSNSSDEGLHAASLGAIWLATINGFANLSINRKQILSFNPELPENWREITFPIQWQGRTLNITITHQNIEIKNVRGPELTVEINGKEYLISSKLDVLLT
ncbi:glycoside hydrolase family 65 protein [Priestia filamentosa]|uniref:Glycosyl hydrolase family 65 n=1 Tax=Priestia filamentosa TaxID=1402861 RepID=A0A1X7EM71_9BACI|nr:glycoside hydrolase family 65 protein [Priestia filamentosa]AKO93163.1 glycosyl hydrolase family 65 [Priestia filamentosa]MDT3763297.1 glycoside hydrolase family 65 protein [Priestia filamentosa]OXS69801.1 glycosyl hydrolase family 65 [Priestia filamentosa]WRU93762.1 glycoside hydrolase family 65 protein [Priestia filamentosa]SMF36371.1 hypothetical glycosyl hydrolase [Priestia filamentosa]